MGLSAAKYMSKDKCVVLSGQTECGELIGNSAEEQMGTPDELGFALAAVADERSGYLAGVDILCDGGSTNGSLCDMASLRTFFTIPKGDESVVIHCASMVTTNAEFNQKLIDVNVAGTQWGSKKYMNTKHLEAAFDDASFAG